VKRCCATLLAWTAVVLLAFGLYGNTLQHGFVLDDEAVIVKNGYVHAGAGGIPQILTSGYWRGAGISDNGYRPLSVVSYALEYEFFGPNPFVFHLGNVSLYALTGIVLLTLLKSLASGPAALRKADVDGFFSRAWPLLATVLFLAHPVHTEVVANIKSRDEILAFLFGAGALYLVLRHYDSGRREWLWFAIIAFFLALLSKENAITLLAVVPLMLAVFTRATRTYVARVSLYFLLACIVYLLLRHLFLQGLVLDVGIANNTVAYAQGLPERYATATYILGRGLLLLAWPSPLLFDYSYPYIPLVQWSDPGAQLAALACGLLLAAAFFLRRRAPLAAFGILWFFITISVVSNFFVLIGATMAERFLYMPSLGFCLALAALLIGLVGRLHSIRPGRHALLLLVAGGIVFSYAYKTIGRNPAWQTDGSLIAADLPKLGGSALAHYHYALALIKLGNQETGTDLRRRLYMQAIMEARLALEISPRYENAWATLGQLYEIAGEPEMAASFYGEALRLNPADERYRESLITMLLQAGRDALQAGDAGLAMKWFSEALDVDPGNVVARGLWRKAGGGGG